MTQPTCLEAWDTLTFANGLAGRLQQAARDIARKQSLKAEKLWLEAAIAVLAQAQEDNDGVLLRSARLPELEAVRDEVAKSQQGAAVDAVERLQAGITFHAGSRSPLLETIFARLKLPALRKASQADFEAFCADFEKRLGASYVKRQLGEPAFAFAAPVVEQIVSAFAEWRGSFSPAPLPDDEAAATKKELLRLAKALELPLKQARLLAEAALLPVPEHLDAAGLVFKPRKRTARAAPAAVEAPAEETPEAAPSEAAAPDAAPKKKKQRKSA